MLVKILGAVDVLSGLMLGISILTTIPSYFLIFFGIALLAKSLVGLLKEFGSWVDFLTGIILILSASMQVPLFIKLIFVVLIVQKGVASFL